MALKFLRSRQRRSDNALRSALGDAALPSFPSIVLKTLEVIREPTATAADIGHSLAGDPELIVRILRLVNSGAFGSRRPITAIDHAVAMAGTGAVESIVLSVGVASSLGDQGLLGSEKKGFWRAASNRAVVAKLFAKRLHPETSDLCFTGGLLQDMAVPLLVEHHEGYRAVFDQWQTSGRDLQSLEQDAFGWDHAEIGGWLCEEWGLPVELCEIVSCHHEDSDGLPPAMRLASLCQQYASPDESEQIATMACTRFGVPITESEELLKQANAESLGIARLLG